MTPTALVNSIAFCAKTFSLFFYIVTFYSCKWSYLLLCSEPGWTHFTAATRSLFLPWQTPVPRESSVPGSHNSTIHRPLSSFKQCLPNAQAAQGWLSDLSQAMSEAQTRQVNVLDEKPLWCWELFYLKAWFGIWGLKYIFFHVALARSFRKTLTDLKTVSTDHLTWWGTIFHGATSTSSNAKYLQQGSIWSMLLIILFQGLKVYHKANSTQDTRLIVHSWFSWHYSLATAELMAMNCRLLETI